LIRTYDSDWIKSRDAVAFLLASLISIGLLAVGTWVGYQGYIVGGLPEATQRAQIWLILAVAGLIPSILLTFRQIQLARRRVQLHKEGLRFVNFPGSPTALRWQEIEGISLDSSQTHFLGRSSKPRTRLIIHPATGDSFYVDDRIKDLDRLAANTKARVFALIFPILRSQLHDGQWLYFGHAKINVDKCVLQRREIEWSDVESVRVETGRLVIKTHDGQAIRHALRDLMNTELLLKLISEDISP
jgi:hypothetical protein